MTLAEILAGLPTNQILVRGSSCDRTVGELLQSSKVIGDRLRGRRIALRLADPVQAVEALIAADGRALSITLLPTSLPEHQLPVLLERAGCDVLIGASQDTSALPSSVMVHAGLAELTDGHGTREGGIETTAWLLATSGTTGPPKLVAHTLSSLSRTTKRGGPAGDPISWGLLYDYTRFAGLQVVLQALFGGSALISPAQDAPLREKLAMLSHHGCTHLSATPTMWRTIVMTPGARRLPLRQVTLGGEIADTRILSTLTATYPNARITHIYASTEAGVGFSVKDGLSGFPARYLDTPPAGLALRISDGRLHIKSSGAAPAYVGTGERLNVEDGWIDTGDNVERIGDRVYFLGRASGVVNVGGNKVHPEEIEALLSSHPHVQASRVFGKSSSIMGTLVVADIVPSEAPEDKALFRRDIKAFLNGRTEPFKVPAIINIVEHIETTDTGKISRGAAS